MKSNLAVRKSVGTPIVHDNSADGISESVLLEFTPNVALPYAASGLSISNTSTESIGLYTGAPGAQIQTGLIIPPGAMNILVPVELRKGVRFWGKAMNGIDATTGFVVITFYQ